MLFQCVYFLVGVSLHHIYAQDCDKECAAGRCHIRSLNNRCYQFNEEEGYWTEAEKACKRIDARLVEIYDMETMQFLKDEMHLLEWKNKGVWNGAHDRHNEGNWKWSSSGIPIDWSYWAPNQPGGFIPSITGSLTDCGVMLRTVGWRWEDYPCRALKFQYRFICDYAPKTKPGEQPMSFRTKALIGFLVGGGILFILIVTACSIRTYMRKSGSFTSTNENELNVYYEANGSADPSKATTSATGYSPSAPTPVKTPYEVEPPPSYNSIYVSATGGNDVKVNADLEDVDLIKRQMHEAEIKRQAIEGDFPENQHNSGATAGEPDEDASNVDIDFEDVEMYKKQLHEAEKKRQALEEHGVASVNLLDVNKENNTEVQKMYPGDKMVPNIVDVPSNKRCDEDSDDSEEKVINVNEDNVNNKPRRSNTGSSCENEDISETNSLLTGEQKLNVSKQPKLNNLD